MIGIELIQLLSNNAIKSAAEYCKFELTKEFETDFWNKSLTEYLLFDCVVVVSIKKNINSQYRMPFIINSHVYKISERTFVSE